MRFAMYVGLDAASNDQVRVGCHLIVKSLSSKHVEGKIRHAHFCARGDDRERRLDGTCAALAC
jgi:hypothetical protein